MKIAILGSHYATVWQAPFDDPEWKIWACSPDNFLVRELPRVDEWFEIHDPARHESRPDIYLEYVRALSAKIPVWMRDRSGHPNARPFPDDAVIREFGSLLLTSSIARILGMAILAIEAYRQAPLCESADGVVWETMPENHVIGLWGILQASKQEYSYQRDGTRYLLQEAHRRGIEIVLPKAAEGILAPVPDNW